MIRNYRNLLSAIAALAFAASSLIAAPQVGKPAPDFKATTSDGKSANLKDYAGKIVVLEWTNYDCPFVKKFYSGGDMQRLQKDYLDKGIVWLTINSSGEGKQGHGTAEQWQQRLAQSKAPAPVLLDEGGVIGKAYDAKATPQFAIIGADGTLLYAGAIDSIRSTSAADIAKADNYVKQVLDAALAGQPLEPFSTTAYGCGIRY